LPSDLRGSLDDCYKKLTDGKTFNDAVRAARIANPKPSEPRVECDGAVDKLVTALDAAPLEPVSQEDQRSITEQLRAVVTTTMTWLAVRGYYEGPTSETPRPDGKLTGEQAALMEEMMRKSRIASGLGARNADWASQLQGLRGLSGSLERAIAARQAELGPPGPTRLRPSTFLDADTGCEYLVISDRPGPGLDGSQVTLFSLSDYSVSQQFTPNIRDHEKRRYDQLPLLVDQRNNRTCPYFAKSFSCSDYARERFFRRLLIPSPVGGLPCVANDRELVLEMKSLSVLRVTRNGRDDEQAATLTLVVDGRPKSDVPSFSTLREGVYRYTSGTMFAQSARSVNFVKVSFSGSASKGALTVRDFNGATGIGVYGGEYDCDARSGSIASGSGRRTCFRVVRLNNKYYEPLQIHSTTAFSIVDESCEYVPPLGAAVN
jgi:hypothetical protein